MTVAIQPVIRFPLYLSLRPRYFLGFDNNLPFRHFIGKFAFAHLSYSYLTASYSLFFYCFMHRCYRWYIIEVVWLVLLKNLIGRPTSIFISVTLSFDSSQHTSSSPPRQNLTGWGSHTTKRTVLEFYGKKKHFLKKFLTFFRLPIWTPHTECLCLQLQILCVPIYFVLCLKRTWGFYLLLFSVCNTPLAPCQILWQLVLPGSLTILVFYWLNDWLWFCLLCLSLMCIQKGLFHSSMQTAGNH